MIIGEPIRVTAPAALPLSLAELKAHARIDLDDEDALVAAYLRAAVEHVEQYTGLALITSTWRQTFSAFPTTAAPDLILRRRPVQSAVVSYLDSGALDTALDGSVYQLRGVGSDKTPATIRLAFSQSWPTPYDAAEAVTVTYVAGFGDDHNAVPELIRHSLLIMVKTWYDYRDDVVLAPANTELPMASKALLRDWRPIALA